MNGGAGRVVCSIPAFEKLYEKDKYFTPIKTKKMKLPHRMRI